MTGRAWRRCGPDLAWGDDSEPRAVFDPATGETHFLTQLPALLLEEIGQTPTPAAELIERLAGPVDLDSDAAARVTAALRELEGAGLIESEIE